MSYSSFSALRQELSKGYAVILSVKYSNKENDDQPYLENAPCHTNGHIITIVGYYYSKELEEYVYCSNDPAGKTDAEVAHREYRQSQLDKAWYRRAAYFIHDKEAGAGLFVRDYVSATLMPVRDKAGAFALVTEDSLLRIPQDFQEGKRQNFGQHGTICYYAEDETTPIPSSCRRVTANHVFRYQGIGVTEEGYLTFANDDMTRLLESGKSVKLLVLDNCDTVYTAAATLDEVFDPDDLETETEAARRETVRRAVRAGAAGAGAAAAAVGAVWLLKKLFSKKK